MKYAHTPMDTSLPSLPPRSDPLTKPDVTKTSSAASASQGRKDTSGTGDGGEESEEERERRLHELQDQVCRLESIRTMTRNTVFTEKEHK